jgi:hypothetical protein
LLVEHEQARFDGVEGALPLGGRALDGLVQAALLLFGPLAFVDVVKEALEVQHPSRGVLHCVDVQMHPQRRTVLPLRADLESQPLVPLPRTRPK